jgi:hypothetical protein
LPNTLEDAGWALVVLGAVLVLAAYIAALRRSKDLKVAVGAAAFLALAWFVAVADWLPPSWKSFWSDHSLTASVVSSALAVLAAWMFADVRQQRRRTASMYSNWRNWLGGQVLLVEDWITTVERDLAGRPAIEQRGLAASARAGLMVQQQWAASTFSVFLTREATDEERGMRNGLTAIRRHGAAAIRELASLEVRFSGPVDAQLWDERYRLRLWEPALVELENLKVDFTKHRDFVGESAFEIASASGGTSE